MSDPIRYNVKCGDEGYQVAESLGGEWVRYSEYLRLKAEVEHWQEQWHFVIEDNNKQMDEVARLKAEVERLEHQVRYWRIEAECDHGRWLRCLEDLEKLRKLK